VTDVCTHLDTIRVTSLPESTCGHIGCCDSSPNRHATAHARSSQHPIIRLLEPDEDWCWCYEDDLVFRVDLVGARP
jgi:hypothetical protein